MNYRVKYIDEDGKTKSSPRFTSVKKSKKGLIIGNLGEGEYQEGTWLFTKETKPQVQFEVCVDSFYGKFKWLNINVEDL